MVTGVTAGTSGLLSLWVQRLVSRPSNAAVHQYRPFFTGNMMTNHTHTFSSNQLQCPHYFLLCLSAREKGQIPTTNVTNCTCCRKAVKTSAVKKGHLSGHSELDTGKCEQL